MKTQFNNFNIIFQISIRGGKVQETLLGISGNFQEEIKMESGKSEE